MTAEQTISEAEALQAGIKVLLRQHYKAACWAWGQRGWDMKTQAGHWSCSCGVSGDVLQGERATDKHREHLAEVITALVMYGREGAQ